MIRTLLTVLYLGCFPAIAMTQCECLQVMESLVEFIEVNYAGFADKVNSQNQKEYQDLIKNLQQKAEFSKDDIDCFVIQKEYLNFFQDQHIQLSINRKGKLPEDKTAIKRHFQDWPAIQLSEAEIKEELSNRPADDIEGVYTLGDSYKIAIIKRPSSRRIYAGIILEADGVYWQKEQVKMEIAAEDKMGQHQVLFYMRDHSLRIRKGRINEQGDLAINNLSIWSRVFPNQEPTKPKLAKEPIQKYFDSPFDIKFPDATTTMLRISSFSEIYASTIDSLIKNNWEEITKRPNLLFDLRGNGGGSDFSYQPLLPLIYTDTIFTIGMAVLASPVNIEAWTELLDYPDIPEVLKDDLRRDIKRMKMHEGSFLDFPDDTTFFTQVLPFPQQVAIVIDENCGSTTEQFLLAAKQSAKVKLFGAATAGVLDYANMRAASLACTKYSLFYATTRSRRVPDAAIDNVGIQPDEILEKNKDWIAIVLNWFDQ